MVQNVLSQDEDINPNFENKGIKTVFEYLKHSKTEQQNTQNSDKFANMSRFMQNLVIEHSKILLNSFVVEANKINDIKVKLIVKPISKLFIKLGNLLRVWLELSQYALFFYEQAFNYDNQSCESLFFIAITLRNLDKTQEAIQYYNQALEINNYYTECYINLGNIYLQEFSNAHVAEKFYVKALISSYCSTMQSPLLCNGRIFNLLGEIQKQQNELTLASVFYSCGILKDSLYEENYYDLIDALNCLEFDVSDSKQYFKIIIELVSFSVFEKSNWESLLIKYQQQLKNIYSKSNNQNNLSLFNMLELITESEDNYLQFVKAFQQASINQNEQFVQTLLKKAISTNIKEIQDIYTRKSIQEESSKEDVQYITILRDFLSDITQIK